MADLSFLPDQPKTEKTEKGDLSFLPDQPKNVGTISKAPPWWMREVVKPTMEFGGMALAEAPIVAGATIFPPASAGAAVAAVPVAGAGYALGKKGYQALESALYGTQEPNQPKSSITQTFKDIGEGAKIQAEGQIAGAALGKVIETIQPYRGKLFEAGKLKPEIKSQIRTFDKYGIDYTYADIVPDSLLPSKVERMFEAFPGGSDIAFRKQVAKVTKMNEIRNTMIRQQGDPVQIADVGRKIKDEVSGMVEAYKSSKNARFNTMLEDFADTFGVSTRSEAGARFSTILQGTKTKMDALEKSKWNVTAQSLPEKGNDKIITPETEAVARKWLAREMQIKPSERDGNLIKRLEGYLPKQDKPIGGPGFQKLNPEVESLGEETTWNGLQDTRSVLLERNREIHARTQRWDTKEQAINSELAGSGAEPKTGILKDMENYAEARGGDTWKLYQEARSTTKRIHDLYDRDVLKIMNSDPASIARRVIKNKDEGLTLLRAIKAISGEEGIKPLRQEFFGELIDASTREGVVHGKIIKAHLNRIGQETAEELLRPEQISFLNNLADKSIQFGIRTGKVSRMKTVSFLDALSSKSDSAVVNMILQPGNDEYAYLANKLLSPGALSELKVHALEKAMMLSGTGNILPVSAMKQLKPGEGTGLEVPLKKLFRQDYEGLREFLDMGRNMTRVEQIAANTSRTAPTLETLSTAKRFFHGPFPYGQIKAAVGVVTENTLARIYFNKSARNFMLKAWKLPMGSRAQVENFVKAFGVLSGEKETEPDTTRFDTATGSP